TNLGKNLSSIAGTPGLDPALAARVQRTIGDLGTAYGKLSDPNQAAPDPRSLYREVAGTYDALTDTRLSKDQQRLVNNGLDILGISAANYDTNRVPVAGTPGTPPPAAPTTPAQAAAAGFPLPDYR